MGWFRKKTEVLDAEHLMQTPAQTGSPAADPGAATMVGSDPVPASALVGAGEMRSEDFQLTVSDVFSIRGRGTVVTGKVEAGSISVGADIAITRGGQPIRRSRVTGVEMFRKTVNAAVAGQEVGLLLDKVERSDVASGDVLTA